MMSKVWRDKDKRQYRHVKQGLEDDGKVKETAEEIASRVVNKQRRKEGETINKTTRGTGNPNLSLEKRTKQELYNRAKELKIKNRSAYNKKELIEAIRDTY